MATEFGLELQVVFVPSKKNETDVLTKVKNPWLVAEEDVQSVVTL